MPRFSVAAITAAKERPAIGMLAEDLQDLYRLLNNLGTIGPNGLTLHIANEGSGEGVYDSVVGQTAYLRSIASGSTAIVASIASGATILLTFAPAAVALSAFAVPTADISLNGYKITNLADATNPQDAVNLETAQSLIGGVSPAKIMAYIENGVCL